MTDQAVLKNLESLLEDFLQRALKIKEKRLGVISSINRLDDIARMPTDDTGLSSRVGEWFAEHNRWLSETSLREGDINRIDSLLMEIGKRLTLTPSRSAESDKMASVLNRWQKKTRGEPGKLILRRGPEAGPAKRDRDSRESFAEDLDAAVALFDRLKEGRPHLMSVLEESLTRAASQKSKQSLQLSAFIIYWLKQDGYLVEPYVKRLKDAERLIREA